MGLYTLYDNNGNIEVVSKNPINENEVSLYVEEGFVDYEIKSLDGGIYVYTFDIENSLLYNYVKLENLFEKFSDSFTENLKNKEKIEFSTEVMENESHLDVIDPEDYVFKAIQSSVTGTAYGITRKGRILVYTFDSGFIGENSEMFTNTMGLGYVDLDIQNVYSGINNGDGTYTEYEQVDCLAKDGIISSYIFPIGIREYGEVK